MLMTKKFSGPTLTEFSVSAHELAAYRVQTNKAHCSDKRTKATVMGCSHYRGLDARKLAFGV